MSDTLIDVRMSDDRADIVSLFAEFDRHDAWALGALTDDDPNAWCASAYELLARVEELPNTPDYLAIRARAIGSGSDNTADLANLNLTELAAHSEGTVGRLVRQVLACVGGPNTRAVPMIEANRAGWDVALADYQAKRAQSDAPLCDADNADAALEAWCAAQDHLIVKVPAPDIGAVLAKADFAAERCEGFGYLDDLWDGVRVDLRRLSEEAAA
jgi:FAD/FMN-containing dehydrogenase